MTKARKTWRRLPAALLAVLLIPVAPASAQSSEFVSSDIAGSLVINQAQRQAIQDAVGTNLPRLASEDPTQIKRGRNNLLRPLGGTGVSVGFRLEYSNQLAAGLAVHARAGKDITAVNALIIAGELATEQSANLLDQFRADQRVSVRYAALSAFKRTFEAMTTNNPAMGAEQAQSFVGKIADQIGNEQHPDVLDAAARALIAAGSVNRPGWEAFRSASFAALARSLGDRARKLDVAADSNAIAPTLVRACEAMRDYLPQLQTNDPTLRVAAEFGGHLLAAVGRRVDAGDYPVIAIGDDDSTAAAKRSARHTPSLMVAVAQTTILFSLDRMAPDNRRDATPLVDEFRKATAEGDQAFLRTLDGVIGPSGYMTRPPISLAAGTFRLK